MKEGEAARFASCGMLRWLERLRPRHKPASVAQQVRVTWLLVAAGLCAKQSQLSTELTLLAKVFE